MLFIGDDQIHMFKANVLEAPVTETQTSDFVSEVHDGKIVFKNTKEIQDMKLFSFSLAYDPTILTFGESLSSLSGSTVSKIENEAGFTNYIISFDAPVSLEKNTEILKTDVQKLQEKTAIINVLQTNFQDSNSETFMLSSSKNIF